MQRLLLPGVCLLMVGTVWLMRPKPSTEPGLDLQAPPSTELAPVACAAGDWPWWRGPTRNNHSPDLFAVKSWSEDENIVWKTAIPGRGHSSPILIGKHIFMTGADESLHRQFTICLDRVSGTKRWETPIHEGSFPPKHAHNSYASGTPASDGERVFVVFPNAGAIRITALDFDGEILWQREAGPHGGEGAHGSGASLALWGSFVFVSDDSPGRGWVAAVHRQSGEIVWRKERKTTMGSYGSPVIAEFEGHTRLLLAGNGKVTAYDPTSGAVIWEQAGLGEAIGNTSAFSPLLIFASSGYPQRKLIALRPDGQVAWKKESGNEIPYPPSLLWHGDHLYAVSDQGLVACFDANTGKQLWKERLEGSFYSSPLLVGKQIYACSRDGTTTVFDANPDGFSVVATNKLNGAVNASPVAVGGKLYVRTETHLYCIGAPSIP